ncbi:YjfB family protein [Proteinivorax tanatarense]|uniref:YjfB family protein n=1 Tax=Proteinivorax tanatarense TaxID=1260629 RepID=A0AAU7VN79_9FIRM
MDIVALSIGLNQMKLQNEVSTSVMKMAMDSAEGQANDMTKILEANTKMMEQSVNSNLGANIDLKV